MPRNPISVGIMFYALQLKEKSNAAGSDGIVRNFRSEKIIFSEKKTEEEKYAQCSLWFQVFTISRAVI